MAGSGAGTFIFSPFSSSLVQRFGWRGCVQVMAGLCLLCSVCRVVMAPVRRVTSGRENRLVLVEIFKNIPFILFMIANIPRVMAIQCTYSYLPMVTSDDLK